MFRLSSDKSKFYSGGNKQEIHVIIQFKHFCLLDLSKNLKIKIYKTIILSVVLYDCEAWSLTLREEHRLKQDPEANIFALFWWATCRVC